MSKLPKITGADLRGVMAYPPTPALPGADAVDAQDTVDVVETERMVKALINDAPLLAEHASLPRQPMQASGTLEDGRYRWRLQSAPWQPPGPQPATIDPGAPQMVRVQLDIDWDQAGPRQRLQVSSLRLVAADGALP